MTFKSKKLIQRIGSNLNFKVVLLNPNVPGDYRKAKIATANLGLGSLSAYIRKHNNVDVEIIDARFLGANPHSVYSLIEKANPQLLGISLLVDEASKWTDELLRLVRRTYPQIPIVLGGYFPSLLPEIVLRKFTQVDTLILGEGERTLSEYIFAIQKKTSWKGIPGIAYKEGDEIVFSTARELIENLDELPFADRYLANNDGREMEVMLEGTRGCPFSCSFCAVHPFYKRSTGSKLRLRSAESIFAEINMLCHKYPFLQCFRFVDPDFISPYTQERAATFAELMKGNIREIHFMMDTRISSIRENLDLLQRLQHIGLKRLYLGIESGSNRILRKMRKGISREETIEGTALLRELGMDYSYGFMMITPWTLEEDIEENVDLLQKIGRIEFRSLFHEMTLIPGTTAYASVQESDDLEWCGSLSYYSFKTKSLRVERFRKINSSLQKNYSSCFGDAAGYLYESIRHLRRLGQTPFAEELEQSLDRLFLEVFHACWSAAATEQCIEKDLDFVHSCASQFSPKFLSLIHRLDPNLDFSSIQRKVPKYAPVRQV